MNKLSITFQQWDQCKIWRQLANWFLKNHDFIHVNSTVAGKYNKHKQDGSHLGFPIRMILATVDLQVTSILSMNFESVQEKKFKTRFSRWPPSLRKQLRVEFPHETGLLSVNRDFPCPYGSIRKNPEQNDRFQSIPIFPFIAEYFEC